MSLFFLLYSPGQYVLIWSPHRRKPPSETQAEDRELAREEIRARLRHLAKDGY